jgi:hypothetical protein
MGPDRRTPPTPGTGASGLSIEPLPDGWRRPSGPSVPSTSGASAASAAGYGPASRRTRARPTPDGSGAHPWVVAIALALVLSVALVLLTGKRAKRPVPPGPLAVLSEARGGYIDQLAAEEIYARKVSLAGLAQPGVYTVIAFTTVHCGLSRDIEARMPQFVAARRDVVYRNVRVFSGMVTFDSKAEMKAWRARSDGIRAKYNLDFGPKVYVYGPDLQPIIGETSTGGEGYRFLYKWMNTTLAAG